MIMTMIMIANENDRNNNDDENDALASDIHRYVYNFKLKWLATNKLYLLIFKFKLCSNF